MKKVRLIMNKPPTNWDARMGPAIGACNDIYFLQNEPWLEVKASTMKQCKEDDVIPWIRTGCGPEMAECEQLGIQIIVGPNAVFACSDRPEMNKRELSSPAIYRLLMSDEVNGDLARKHATYDTAKIQQVPYFMRPELYDEPFKYRKEWDVYYHIKTSVNKFTRSEFKSITSTHHGWYDFPELKFKAQHSNVCVHACAYDNYGLAIHEISILGCPIVYDNTGFKRGSVGEGMGIEVSSVNSNTPEEGKEIVEAIHKAAAMDRKKVWEASKEYQSVENCIKRYKKAIYGSDN